MNTPTHTQGAEIQIEDTYPLFPLQHGMLVNALLEPGSGVDIEQLLCELHEALDVAVFRRAWQCVVARHPVLRTSLRWDNLDEPRQVVHAQIELPWEEQDWSALDANQRGKCFADFLDGDRLRGFDLARAPMFRLTLLRYGEAEFHLVWTFHHTILEGRSYLLVLREVFAFYEASRDGREISVPLPRPYRDYIDWIRQQDFGKDESFWREMLKGFTTPTPLAVDHAPDISGDRRPGHGSCELVLSAPITSALRVLSRANQLNLNTIVQGAWALLLSRYSGEADVVFGVVRGNRRFTIEGAEAMIGLFLNTLPLRVHVNPEAALLSWLHEVRRQWTAMRGHEHTPLARVQGWSEVPGGTSLFQSTLMFENYHLDTMLQEEGGAWSNRRFRLFLQTNYPVSLAAFDGAALRLRVDFDRSRLDDGAAWRMLGHLQTLFEAIVADPEQRVGELPLLTESERHQLLVEWNDTAADYPRDRCLHQLFEAQAARTPKAVAVMFENQQLTYAELNARANQLARHLIALGVGPDVLVGICAERSLELMVGLLGILKAGGAYVPMDPGYPQARIAFMLTDTRAPVLLTQQRLLGQLPRHEGHVVCLDSDWATIGVQNDANPAAANMATGLAYVIYTSGSTGRPKGVCITHRGLVNYLTWAVNAYAVTSDAAISVHSSVAFDLTVTSLYAPLLAGGTVCLLPEEQEVQTFAAALMNTGANYKLIKITPAHLSVLAQQVPAEQAAQLARVLVVGGEQLNAEAISFWRQHAADTVIVNEYGPTETVVGCCAYTVTPDTPSRGPIPIGRPIANTRIYILDQHGRPVPVNVTGELYVGGDGVGRGYLNRPELTAEKFLPDPFSTVPGGRMYLTGDRARYLADGNVEFLGRTDDQVKIRGFRIELGEIEAVLAEHAAVRLAVILAREDSPGDKRLVAYVVPADPSFADVEALRAFLRERLPEYMQLAAYVVLESLPLTPNGKVDKRALPAPQYDRDKPRDALVAPRNALEEVVAEVWRDVLKIERVSVHDDFFELGGQSLLAVQVLARIARLLKVELPLRDFFATPTVSAVAAAAQKKLGAGKAQETAPIAAAPRSGNLPLSFAQQRLWFLDRLLPEKSAYNIPAAWRLQGRLEVPALERSLNALVARHEALRTRFAVCEGEPVQVIEAPHAMALPLADLSAMEPDERAAREREIADSAARQPFDLEAGPLLRARLLRLAPEEHVLLLNVHHIASDGWSMGIIERDLSADYAAFSKGRESQLPELPIQYADYAVWQRERLQGEVLKSQLDYWKSQLANINTLELPTDRPRPPVASYEGAHLHFDLPAPLTEALKALCRREGATLFMTLLAAFQVLLYRYSGQPDIAVGSPIAGRGRSELEGLIGFFVNTLVLRTDLSGNPQFRELLARVRENSLDAYTHQDLPFEKLVEELAPPRDMSRNPMFDVMFALQNAPGTALALEGVEVSLLPLQRYSAKLDLTLVVQESAQGLQASWEYASDLFDAPTIDRMARHFQALLEAVVADPGQRIGELPLLTESERQRVLVQWNDTAADYPGDRCMHKLFEAQTARTPEAVAVVFEDRELTYAELNARANQLANYLIALEVGPEVLVGLCVERSLEMVVGLLGILKAGGAYVPLDPGYPSERLAFMLEDTGARIVLTQGKYSAALSCTGARVVCLDQDWPVIQGQSTETIVSGAGAENLAYMIYTSGSTGQPKGAMIPHRAVVNHLRWMHGKFPMNERDCVLQKTPFSFDVSMWEFFAPLSVGARLVMAHPAGHQDPAYLANMIVRHQVTVLQLVPSLLRMLLDTPEFKSCHSLRHVFCGGEAMTGDIARRFFATLGADLHNMYGPTEAAIDTLSYTVPREHIDEAVPIGRPVANTQAYVLDGHGQPQPIGVPGELYLGGGQVGRGYHGQPELTAEKFLPDPFSIVPGARMYRTGDLARYRPDGNIVFLGRTDYQVKIRGYRIELGEIEAALARLAQVQEAVVVVREDELGNRSVVAYVVPAAGQANAPRDLRSVLKQNLPDYMVPSAFVMLDTLPLTPSGKVDRGALPATDSARRLKAVYAPPRTEWELKLANIWQKVLRVEKVGVDDNFFDLGGHSLMIVQLIHEINRTHKVSLSVPEVFRNPTVQQMAAMIDKQPPTSKRQPSVIQLREGRTEVPVYFIYAGPDEFRLAQWIGGSHPVFGIDVPWPLAWRNAVSENRRSAFPTMDQFVAPYVAALSAHARSSPCVLAGHSFAGLIAFEAAHQFQKRGGKVEMVFLLDSWARVPSPYQVAWHNLWDCWKPASDGLREDQHARSTIARVRRSWRITRWLFGQAKNRLRPFFSRPKLNPNDLTTSLDEQGMLLPGWLATRLQKMLQKSYHPRPLNSRGTLFRADSQDERAAVHGIDESLGWKNLFARGLEIIPITGDHLSIIREHDSVLARELGQVMERHWPSALDHDDGKAVEPRQVDRAVKAEFSE